MQKITGGLRKNIDEALEAGERVEIEVETNSGEAVVVTDRRVMLVRAGFLTYGLGKVQSFTYDSIVKLTFKDSGMVGKLRIHTPAPDKPEYEINVVTDPKHVKPTREAVNLIESRISTNENQTAEVLAARNRPTSSLPGKVGQVVSEALRPNESILKELENAGQGIVVTSERVLIVKVGIASQAWFGHKVKSFPFDQITSVEVSTGLMLGRLQITVPGSQETAGRTGFGETAYGENMIDINTAILAEAREIANLIEEKVREAKQPRFVAQAPAPAAVSLGDEIRKLMELRDMGVLTEEEFTNAKARLLNQ